MTFATETRKLPATSQAAPLAEIAIRPSLARASRAIPVDDAPLGGGLPHEVAGRFNADLPDGVLADADPLVRDHCRQRTGMHAVLTGACEA